MASVRRCYKLPLCPIESMPASSKVDLLLTKAEPTSNSGSASVIIHVTRVKSCCTTATAAEKRSENM